ncbi:methyltransferase [Colletotrichum graminicola]|uniref:Methyltransferase n=1 Tax=Colletotrichum graminicola (strain M1.001 / M2 / FGSC 10212) TaxID=645133 RepID=E3QGJ2_COLGM|nr:methyltransferase [Colletotrichum graminicola M1.001]EFQ29980.1 methyltransferase [Colletotrichum graminicola M1.001]WDK09865.1 methyltransferase [Colletotrichum graminicola]
MAIDRVPRGDVRATLNFFAAPADNSVPYNIIHPEGTPERNYGDSPTETVVHDIRGRESDFNLDRDAFAVIRNLPPSSEKDFVDDASVERNYYPEVEKLILEHVPGSNRVLFFDHTIRRTGPKALRSPVTRVHIDQTPVSVIQRIRKHLPDEADKLLAGRYRIINVWQPLNKNPVESFPLAFASSSTLADEDIVPVEHRYTTGYTGQTAAIKFNPGQKWHYLSGMTGDERLLLECFDSEGLRDGTGVAGGRVAHTAFEDPRSRADAEGRESIEVRALVFGP